MNLNNIIFEWLQRWFYDEKSDFILISKCFSFQKHQ